MQTTIEAGMTEASLEWELSPIDYYSPEVSAFQNIARIFAETGTLDPAALYLILDWKAPRARTRHLARLSEIGGGDFSLATKMLATELSAAATPRKRLELLLRVRWSFRLPTASAVLSMLFPDDFSVYDVRVCESLGGFSDLGDLNWKRVWPGYEQFLVEVRAKAPAGLSLRDCDRWHWGESKRRDLMAELADPERTTDEGRTKTANRSI